MLQAKADSSVLSRHLQTVLVGLAYLALAELGHLISRGWQDLVFSPFWMPNGLYVAALTLSSPRHWWQLILSASIANLCSDLIFHDRSILVSAGNCIANFLTAATGAYMLRRLGNNRFRLTTLRDVAILTATVMLSSAGTGAVVGGAVAYFAVGNVSFPEYWAAWFLSDSLGVIVTAPIVFAWAEHPLSSLWALSRERIIEGIIAFACLAGVMELVFGGWLPSGLSVPIWTLPFLLWIAIRFSLRGTSAAVITVALIGVWHSSHGRGPFVTPFISTQTHVLRTQASLGISAVSVLLLAGLIAERKRAEREKNALVLELQEALAAIKTLRGMIPMCAWCRKVRDDKQDWHCVEDFIAENTEARMSHGICPVCYAKQAEYLENLDV